MSESIPPRLIQPDQITQKIEEGPHLPNPENVAGWDLSYTTNPKAKKIAINLEEQSVVINLTRFSNFAEAIYFGTLSIARWQSSVMSINNPNEAVEFKKIAESEIKETLNNIMAMRGFDFIRRNRLEEKKIDFPPAQNFSQEFLQACYFMILNNDYDPKNLQVSLVVQEQLQKIPINKKTGESLLSSLSSPAIALSSKIKNYDNFILPLLAELSEIDKQALETAEESFKPNTENIETEEMDESNLEQWITPYFRENLRLTVSDQVDWDNRKMVATSTEAIKFETPNDNEEYSDLPQYTFYGKLSAQTPKVLDLALPATAIPLTDTFSEPGGTFRLNSRGLFSLAIATDDLSSDSTEKIYSFSMIRKSKRPWRSEIPTEFEQVKMPNYIFETLTSETREFLNKLKNANLTNKFKAQQIIGHIYNTFEYINSDEIGSMVDNAGINYFTVVEEFKKADCDLANFYALAQLRYLGIPCRMVTGYLPKKTSSGYLAVGGTLHAWLEIYDEKSRQWISADATPPKKDEKDKEDKDEDNKDDGTGGDDLNEGAGEEQDDELQDQDDELGIFSELTEEQLQKLQEKIAEAVSELADEPTAEVSGSFLDKTGVEYAEWKKVLTYLQKVNKTPVPKEFTITKKESSTIEKEWETILKSLIIAYRIPTPGKIIHTTQDLGDHLDDASIAVTDILTGSDNIGGFIREKKGEREIKMPIGLSIDFLTDTTASMDSIDEYGNNLLVEQKKFVLTLLYQLHLLNRGLQQHETELTDVPYIGNHTLSIHGKHNWKELSEIKIVDEKTLATLYKSLDETMKGGGDMYNALLNYKNILVNDTELLQDIQSERVVKILNIISDGNLWCSVCRQESCNYQHDTKEIAKTKKLIAELRNLGVIINGIGFTEQSRPVISLFNDEKDPNAVMIADNTPNILSQFSNRLIEILKPIIGQAYHKLPTS